MMVSSFSVVLLIMHMLRAFLITDNRMIGLKFAQDPFGFPWPWPPQKFSIKVAAVNLYSFPF